MGGEHGSSKGEWKRKNGVLPLDHLQCCADAAQQCHLVFRSPVTSVSQKENGLAMRGEAAFIEMKDRRYFFSGCPATCRLLVTLKTPGTEFARIPAASLSPLLSTTP